MHHEGLLFSFVGVYFISNSRNNQRKNILTLAGLVR